MTDRIRAVWLPGLAAVLVAEGSLYLLQQAGVRPLTFFLDWHHPLQFYVSWLLLLPLVGAVAALWSRRAGGTSRQRVLAAAMPALAELGLIIFGTVVDIIGDVGGGRHSIWHTFCGTGSFSVSRMLVPGLALLLGAAPFVSRLILWRPRSTT